MLDEMSKNQDNLYGALLGEMEEVKEKLAVQGKVITDLEEIQTKT